jgi:hypothetical protein
MKPTVNPQVVRIALSAASMVVALGGSLFALWQRGGLTWQTGVMTVFAGVAAWLQGKQSEAPGAVPVWELPKEIRESVSSTMPVVAAYEYSQHSAPSESDRSEGE